MSKIYGDQATIKKAQALPPGDKSGHVNWEAIQELPDEFEVIITEVKYDPAEIGKLFSDVGNKNYMPSTVLMYKIAEACGIGGNQKSISSPIQEEIDINPMLCKPMEAEPTIRKMVVGRSVSKQSSVMQEDGTLLHSSVSTCEYNAWERCTELWAKEEKYTDGYAKQSKYEPKYNNKFKRQHHFKEELKFAHAKAETKSHLKTVRELAKLTTGYKEDDLKSGSLFFAKVRRSREILQAETAARLTALSQGALPAPEPIKMLFGDADIQEPETKDVTPDPFDVHEPAAAETPVKSNREIFIETVEEYFKNEMVHVSISDGASKVLNWVKNTAEAETDKLWNAAITRLKEIEKNIPDEAKINHGLY